jgi:hypothetical protein
MTDPGWGVASGWLSGTQEQQAIALNNIKLQEGPITLESEKLALETQKQQVAMHNKLLQTLNSQPQSGADPIGSAAETFFRVGQAQLESGLPEEAMKTIATGQEMLDRQSQVAYRAFEAADKQAQYVEQMVAGVADAPNQEQAYNQAVAIAKMHFGEKSINLPPWDPVKGPQVLEAYKRAAEAHRTEAQKQLDRAKIAKENADAEYARQNTERAKATTRLDNDRAEAIEKNSGKGGSGMPKSSVVTAITNKLKTMYPDQFEDSSGYRDLAMPMALEVQRMMDKEKKNLPDAINAVIRSDQLHGRLGGLKPARPGERQTNPAAIPRTADGKVDVSQMKDGGWYKTPTGEAGYYDAAKGGLVVPDARDDDEEDDE